MVEEISVIIIYNTFLYCFSTFPSKFDCIKPEWVLENHRRRGGADC